VVSLVPPAVRNCEGDSPVIEEDSLPSVTLDAGVSLYPPSLAEANLRLYLPFVTPILVLLVSFSSISIFFPFALHLLFFPVSSCHDAAKAGRTVAARTI